MVEENPCIANEGSGLMKLRMIGTTSGGGNSHAVRDRDR